MDGEAESLARAIGARVKQRRERRESTLDQRSAASGVSWCMVVNAEQGAVSPSVGTLLRLSDAIGVGLPALAERPDVVELWDWTLAPGDRHSSKAHATGTPEHLHVHERSFTVFEPAVGGGTETETVDA